MNATAIEKRITLAGTTIEAARPRVEAALKDEGFGVLTEIDLAATFKKKLGVDWPPSIILGACNPALAHQALSAEPGVAALLPCNITLRQTGDDVQVGTIDAMGLFSMVGNPGVEPIARTVGEKLERVLDRLRGES